MCAVTVVWPEASKKLRNGQWVAHNLATATIGDRFNNVFFYFDYVCTYIHTVTMWGQIEHIYLAKGM